jgi:hypothetical protein
MADLTARFTTLTRLGFAARGLLYIVIAFLVLTTGRAEDPAGALQTLGQGGGRVLLALMALGMMAYGLWRLSDAAFNIEQHDANRGGVVARLAAAGSGLTYLFLSWQAVRLFRGTGGETGDSAQQGAQSVLQLPGGQALLLLGGAILIGAGLFQLFKAAKDDFLKHLARRVAAQPWAKWSGRLGYAARGLVFLITGYFLLRAGLQEQASEAGDMAAALAWLTDPWDSIVAIGLFAFGLFSLIEARYRILHNIPVDHAVGRLKAKLH